MRRELGRYLVLLALAFFGAVNLNSAVLLGQDTDNQGREFILGFMENLPGVLGVENVELLITGDLLTNGTVEIPGLAFSAPFSVVPGTVTSVNLPLTAKAFGSDIVESKGVRVIADEEVVVYGLNQRTFTTGAFLGLPTDILGTDHVLLGFEAASNVEDSEFMIVGVEDGTNVTITPSLNTGTRSAGVPYTITLNRLETYQLVSDTVFDDVSGTLVESDQPVAVFSGAKCADIPIGFEACDHLVEQIPPTDTWGSDFLTVPLATRLSGDIFRIAATNNNTDVSIDGALVAILDRGEFFEADLPSGTFHEIQTNEPALVMQYAKSSDTDNVLGDPFMMMLPPTDQFLNGYTVGTPAPDPVAFDNFINVVVATPDIQNCTVDGAPFTGPFTQIGTSGFSGAQEAVSLGAHVLSCPNPFGAYSYGFAFRDSYGYPAGLSLASTPTSLQLEKDYRFTDVCFDCQDDVGLGSTLPMTSDGSFLVKAVVKKNGNVVSSNPGQFYGVTTINVSTDLEELWIEEDFSDCLGMIKLNPPRGGGSVVVLMVTGDGSVYQVANAKSQSVALEDGVVTAYLENVPADSSILYYLKFKQDLDRYSEPLSCRNNTSVYLKSVGSPVASAEATLALVKKARK